MKNFDEHEELCELLHGYLVNEPASIKRSLERLLEYRNSEGHKTPPYVEHDHDRGNFFVPDLSSFDSTRATRKAEKQYEPYPGMSLRDYFAAKAMQALVSAEEWSPGKTQEEYKSETGSFAYQLADAMMEARNE